MNIKQNAPRVNGSDEDDLSALREEIAALRREVQELRRELSEPDAPELLSVEAAAERLSVSERTLRSLLSDETVRSVKIGRRRLVPAAALREFIEKRMDND